MDKNAETISRSLVGIIFEVEGTSEWNNIRVICVRNVMLMKIE